VCLTIGVCDAFQGRVLQPHTFDYDICFLCTPRSREVFFTRLVTEVSIALVTAATAVPYEGGQRLTVGACNIDSLGAHNPGVLSNAAFQMLLMFLSHHKLLNALACSSPF
jgi:hypothetical protein